MWGRKTEDEAVQRNSLPLNHCALCDLLSFPSAYDVIKHSGESKKGKTDGNPITHGFASDRFRFYSGRHSQVESSK